MVDIKSLFFKIDKTKREKLIYEAIKEFSKHYYFEASLNKIIKNTGISKGGLFKYIESKEDLYLFLFEQELSNLVIFQASSISKESQDFFVRIRDIAIKSIEFYESNPYVYQFILKALTDQSAVVYQEVMKIRNHVIVKYQQQLLEGVDYSKYRFSKEHMLKIYRWITSGIDNQIINGKNSINDILKMLELVINALQYGVRM